MRTKRVPCPECGGIGFVQHTKIDHESGTGLAWSEECPRCNGWRIVEVPMTNADLIRGMTDEELANMLVETDWCEQCIQQNEDGTCKIMNTEDNLWDGKLHDHCVAGALNWLRQPVKEDTP